MICQPQAAVPDLGVPEHEPGAAAVVDAVQVELLPELAVVPAKAEALDASGRCAKGDNMPHTAPNQLISARLSKVQMKR